MSKLSSVAVALGALATFSMAPPVHAQSQEWSAQVASLVSKNFTYPRSAVVRKEEGTAIVKITVAPNGSITAVEIAQSTGSRILDREAVRMAQRLGRLPAPPPGVSRVNVPIRWQLN